MHKKPASAQPTLGTFHSLGLHILRQEIGRLGYGRGFTIADTDDQLALVKRIMVELELDTKKFNPAAVLNGISKLKTDLVPPEEYRPTEFFPKIVAQVYAAYQRELKRINAVDFDDLIGMPVKIFKTFPDVLESCQNRWRYLLVDEYQDTSHDQYTFITLLAAAHRNIFCIGDDAQSIYMFRDADIRNILNFQHDYPEGKVLLLEQNYRSTKTILAAAQNIITNNKNQIPKELWTENTPGEKIIVREALNERDEAQFVVETIVHLTDKGYGLRDSTVLYRTHAQSRALEEALIENGVPYQIVGGIKFYERKEIKDILAYLRFLHNPSDILSFERIANVPSRGIGKSTLERIVARGEHDILEGLRAIAKEKGSTKQSESLKTFGSLLANLRTVVQKQPISKALKTIIKKTDYENYLINLKGDAYENTEERIENLRELFTVARKYDQRGTRGAEHFLEEVALLQETDRFDATAPKITLMTMHSSKGLEFPIVFIVGMEEGLFPHSRTIFAPHELEEERRLCYVAVTRAKERLYLSFAKYRRISGSAQANLPSRFLGEMPQHLLEFQLAGNGLNSDEDDYTIKYD